MGGNDPPLSFAEREGLDEGVGPWWVVVGPKEPPLSFGEWEGHWWGTRGLLTGRGA